MKSLNIKWIIGAIVVIVVVIIVVITNGSKSVSNSIIKVGVIAPLTGQYGSLGESFKNAVILAVGDDKRIEPIFEDSKFDAKQGLSAFQKLTSVDHVDMIIVEDSPTLEAITPILNETHMPAILIFEATDHAKDSIFQMIPFSYPLFTDLGKLASSHYQNIALAYSVATNVLSVDADYFKQGVVAPSRLVNETKVAGVTDFRSEVTKILASNPDAVTNIFALSDGIKFIKELNAQKGTRKVALICDANTEFALADYIKALGTSTFEGCLSTNLPNLTTDQFSREYSAKFGSNPLIGADWGYDAVTIVKGLVNTPKDQWNSKIQSSNFDGVSGHVSFDENGTRIAASERHVFKDGKFVKLEE